MELSISPGVERADVFFFPTEVPRTAYSICYMAFAQLQRQNSMSSKVAQFISRKLLIFRETFLMEPKSTFLQFPFTVWFASISLGPRRAQESSKCSVQGHWINE